MCVPEMQNMLISTNQHPRHSGLNQSKPRPCEMGGRQVGQWLLEKEWKAFARFRFFSVASFQFQGRGACLAHMDTRISTERVPGHGSPLMAVQGGFPDGYWKRRTALYPRHHCMSCLPSEWKWPRPVNSANSCSGSITLYTKDKASH